MPKLEYLPALLLISSSALGRYSNLLYLPVIQIPAHQVFFQLHIRDFCVSSSWFSNNGNHQPLGRPQASESLSANRARRDTIGKLRDESRRQETDIADTELLYH